MFCPLKKYALGGSIFNDYPITPLGAVDTPSRLFELRARLLHGSHIRA